MLTGKEIPKISLVGKIFFGTVVDNNDPLKLGRVRIKLEFYEDVKTELIPWSVIMRNILHGGGQGNGDLYIPRLNSYVAVQHINGDPHMPVCIGEVDVKPFPEVLEDYPNTYGHKDPNGNYFTENLIQKIRTMVHNGILKLTNSGNIEINETGDVGITINGNVNANVTGNLVASIDGESTITCPKNTINGDVIINGNQTINGNQDISGNNIIKGEMHSANYDVHTHLYNPGPGGPTPSAVPDK